MGQLTPVERNQFAPRTQFTRQQRYATCRNPRPQQERNPPDILNLVGMVNIEETTQK
jgi:hypothetical protein